MRTRARRARQERSGGPSRCLPANGAGCAGPMLAHGGPCTALHAVSSDRMKIAMMGSGGVGGFFGGRLAKAGYDVTFIARGAHLAAMRANGLTIESEAQGNIHVPNVKATENPADVGPV